MAGSSMPPINMDPVGCLILANGKLLESNLLMINIQ